jgi:YesN/AraC family two-component response regulator
MRAGASAYLCKPVNFDALSDRMESLIAQVDAASLRAKTQMEHVVQSELVRWAPRLADGSGDNEMLTQSLERAARSRAHKAFIAAGGTRAHFDRWWSHVFGSARANSGVALAAES